MTEMRPSLVGFLEARLAEDEAAASEASGDEEMDWHYIDGTVQANVRRGSQNYPIVSFTFAGEHIARHDPSRVLREVEAKRRLLIEHNLAESTDWRWFREGKWGHAETPHQWGCERCDDNDGWLNGSDGCTTLLTLAAVYCEHRDYDPAWAAPQ